MRTRSGPWPAVTRFVGSLDRGVRLIDVGAGSGRYLAVKEAQGLRLVGADISRGQLKVARRMVPRDTALVRADARALPLRDGAAQAALCVAVLHHIFDQEGRVAAARETRRILREGGRALFSAWSSDAEVFEGARKLEGGGRNDFIVPFKEKLAQPAERFFHAYEAGELAQEARDAGFSRVREWTEQENRFVECVR